MQALQRSSLAIPHFGYPMPVANGNGDRLRQPSLAFALRPNPVHGKEEGISRPVLLLQFLHPAKGISAHHASVTRLHEETEKFLRAKRRRPFGTESDHHLLILKVPDDGACLPLEGFELQQLTACGVLQPCHLREPHLEVVADFGHGSDRGPRVADGVLLLYGNGRSRVFNLVHLRSLAGFKELPHVGAEGLHVLPLALGVQDVEEEGGFSRSAQPREDDQLPRFQFQVNRLQVVVARSPNPYVGRTGSVHALGLAVIPAMARKLCEAAFPARSLK